MTNTDTSTRPPFWHRRWVQVTGAALGLMIVSGGSAAAATELASHPAVVQRPAAATAPAKPKATAPAKPKAPAKPSPKASAPSQAPAQQAPANPAPLPSRSDGQYPSSSPSTPQLTMPDRNVAGSQPYFQDVPSLWLCATATRALRSAPVRSTGSRMPCRERAVELVAGREPGTHRQNWAGLCAPASPPAYPARADSSRPSSPRCRR